MPILRIVG